MHGWEIPDTVAAIGRAGAGTNNIPVNDMSARGVPVFNAPGANANAVKELVIAGLLMAARNLCDAREHVKDLSETGEALNKAVEAGKKQFVGFELPGKTLGVIGLGAIGVEVANAALENGRSVPLEAGLMGIITLEDVLEALLQEDILDEMDAAGRMPAANHMEPIEESDGYLLA